jgi:hypothetical protein|tara:strand:- start:3902 stop:4210 length:309 start_codon:yes stop_codon:yes gene_type:complete
LDEIQFIPIELVDPHVFNKMVNMLNNHPPARLHMLNEVTVDKFKKTIIEFIDYLIHVSEHLEEYETCTELIKKRTAYLKWLQGNRTTITVINNIINEFKDQI